jgi:protease I
MSLAGKKVIILSENFYEDLELWYPYYRLKEEGAEVKVVGMPGVESYGSKHGYPVKPDITPQEVEIESIDALLVPGGYAPDKLRRYPEMVALVRKAFDQGSVVGMICHAGWLPISAGIIKGKKVTSVSGGGRQLDQFTHPCRPAGILQGDHRGTERQISPDFTLPNPAGIGSK